MKIVALRPDIVLPKRGSAIAAGFDIVMPEEGTVMLGMPVKIGLGFAAAVPAGYAALLLPRSGMGTKHGIELCNTTGLIDADYTGEWFATITQKSGYAPYRWQKGDRILQFLVVPVWQGELEVVESLEVTDRGAGGHGSTGI